MAENTKIEWCDHTFNPWIGCTKVSPACDNCYAATRDMRFTGGACWGAKASRQRTSPANWKKPLLWNRKAQQQGIRYKVFCASLADVFDNHKSILPVWRQDLWDLIHATPHLDWLLLTKRPQNIEKMKPKFWGRIKSHVWLGTTVENQREADRRIPHLIKHDSAVRFLSCEPLLGELALLYWLIEQPGIDWIIAGGESGPNARPSHPDWFRSLEQQCIHANVPFHFKQWGEFRPCNDDELPERFGDECKNFKTMCSNGFTGELSLESAFLHKPSRFPQCFPDGPDGDADCNFQYMRRVGKKRAGRKLDGKTHDAFPASKLTSPDERSVGLASDASAGPAPLERS